MAYKLTLPKSNLPNDSESAAELIYEYFNAFDIELNETADSFLVDLSANQYTYCEDITCGLQFLGISEKEISTFCPLLKDTALCLSENWLPYALLELQKKAKTKLDMVTIIHVDDHQDLMPPFISRQNEHFFDMISGEMLSFSDIDSISRAVRSGAITIGSMLSTIIYPISKSNVIHIKQGATTGLYGLSKETFHDVIIPAHGDRICISKKDYTENEQFYFSTDSWVEAEKRVPNDATCILHIDMDYFNNRYNASTDWNENPNRLDTPFYKQKELIDELVSTVSRIHQRTKIEFLLIGISPSFYPAEFWADGLKYLLHQLHEVGVGAGVDILKSHMVRK